MMRHWDDSWGWGNWLVMGLGMLVFWTLVAVAIVWLIRAVGPGPSARPTAPLDQATGSHRSAAREILDERYVRGEISDEEYRDRRERLASG